MDVLTAIKERRSIRKFKSKALSRAELENIADAGRLAATARNVQPWEFIAVTDKTALSKLAAITDYGKFLKESAAAIVVFCEDTKYYLEDGSAATQNMLVAAAGLGIGSCWIAGDKKAYASAVAELFNVPAKYKLVSIIALGYPDAKSSVAKRELASVLHWEKF